jgi:hypothetical protein
MTKSFSDTQNQRITQRVQNCLNRPFRNQKKIKPNLIKDRKIHYYYLTEFDNKTRILVIFGLLVALLFIFIGLFYLK